MTEEFDLSKKRKSNSSGNWFYYEKNVKEFIKRDKELIRQLAVGEITYLEFHDKRDKLIGEKLL